MNRVPSSDLPRRTRSRRILQEPRCQSTGAQARHREELQRASLRTVSWTCCFLAQASSVTCSKQVATCLTQRARRWMPVQRTVWEKTRGILRSREALQYTLLRALTATLAAAALAALAAMASAGHLPFLSSVAPPRNKSSAASAPAATAGRAARCWRAGTAARPSAKHASRAHRVSAQAAPMSLPSIPSLPCQGSAEAWMSEHWLPRPPSRWGATALRWAKSFKA